MESSHNHTSHSRSGHAPQSLNRLAASATAHCLTGCAIGEVLGMVIGTGAGLSNTVTVGLSIVLAFFFGYSLTVLPLVRSGLALAVIVPLALASDTISITIMELVDNGVMIGIPGALNAGLDDFRFWGPLALSLAIAFAAAWPVNRYLIARGRGHAVVHELHHGDGYDADADGPKLRPVRLAVLGIAAIAFTVAIGVTAASLVDHGSPNDAPTHDMRPGH